MPVYKKKHFKLRQQQVQRSWGSIFGMCQNIKSSVTGTEGGTKLEGNELGKLANGWLIQNPVEAMGSTLDFILSMMDASGRFSARNQYNILY